MSDIFNVKWCKYIPKEKKPTSKQIAFLSLPHLEAFLVEQQAEVNYCKREVLFLLHLDLRNVKI